MEKGIMGITYRYKYHYISHAVLILTRFIGLTFLHLSSPIALNLLISMKTKVTKVIISHKVFLNCRFGENEEQENMDAIQDME